MDDEASTPKNFEQVSDESSLAVKNFTEEQINQLGLEETLHHVSMYILTSAEKIYKHYNLPKEQKFKEILLFPNNLNDVIKKIGMLNLNFSEFENIDTEGKDRIKEVQKAFIEMGIDNYSPIVTLLKENLERNKLFFQNRTNPHPEASIIIKNYTLLANHLKSFQR